MRGDRGIRLVWKEMIEMNRELFKPSDFALPILDAHHHFFFLDGRAHYPWLQDEYNSDFFLGDYKAMCRTYGIREYQESTEGFNVIGSVHVEAERSRKEQVLETLDLVELQSTQKLPTAIVGHVYFTQPDVEEVLKAHATSPLVKGIRSKPVTTASANHPVVEQEGTMRDVKWQEGLALLEKYDFSWDLRVPYWHLQEAADVLADFTSLPVVINHAGLPLDRSDMELRKWRSGMEALASLPNTTVKVSELGLKNGLWDLETNYRVIRETTEIFGFDRSMFASNLPVSSLSTSFRGLIRTVLEALPGASHDELTRLFSETAMQFYRVNFAETPGI